MSLTINLKDAVGRIQAFDGGEAGRQERHPNGLWAVEVLILEEYLKLLEVRVAEELAEHGVVEPPDQPIVFVRPLVCGKIGFFGL